MAKYTQDEIFTKVCDILTEAFECDRASLTMDTGLFTDLDLDSIDAVDLLVKLREFTEKRVSPDQFRTIRTIGDVVRVIDSIVNAD